MSRYFTLDQAKGLLPVVDRVVRSAVHAKSVYDQSDESMQNLLQRIIMSGGLLVDRLSVEAIRSSRQTSGDRLRVALEEIQDLGCLVKDLEKGLIDFPTLLRGEEVYLCWHLGEADIQFWHGVHEGFNGRKTIDRFFLDNHQGSEPS